MALARDHVWKLDCVALGAVALALASRVLNYLPGAEEFLVGSKNNFGSNWDHISSLNRRVVRGRDHAWVQGCGVAVVLGGFLNYHGAEMETHI